MNPRELKKLAMRAIGSELGGRSTDPRYIGSLTVLPNPDPILRQMGQAESVYDAIMSDAHVIGELRTMKATLQNFYYRVSPPEGYSDGSAEKASAELCEQFLRLRPAPGMTWRDVFWNMGTAALRGMRVHELEWEYWDGYLLPLRVLDRPNRRFTFNTNNDLRLLTRLQPVEGEPCDPLRFVMSRHMPSYENPYGVALLSSCFWPYTFKHGGFKFFYQFCERFGLPWPIGKYPAGTPINEQNDLLDALIQMLQSGVAVIPDGDSIELKEVSVSGTLVQEAIIHVCNREMSKALTSQTLATETGPNGARAAAQVHADRQDSVGESDRSIIETTMSEILAAITLVNFGADVTPPLFEFYSDDKGTKERAETYEIATRLSKRVSLAAFHKEMGIPIAQAGEEVLSTSTAVKASPVGQSAVASPSEFSRCPGCGHVHSFSAAHDDQMQTAIDNAIARDWIEPVADMLRQYEADGKTIHQFMQDLPKVVGKMDDTEVNQLFSQAMRLAFAQGMNEPK